MSRLYDDHHFARTVTDNGTRGVLVLIVGRTTGKDGAKLYKIREITSNGDLRSWEGTARCITRSLDAYEKDIVQKIARFYHADGQPKLNVPNHPSYGPKYGVPEPS